jgi:hypothetical protein
MGLVLIILAIIFAAIAIVESKGKGWAAWGVLMLALLHLLGTFGRLPR